MRINFQIVRSAVLAVGMLGLAAVIYGGVNAVSAISRYNELDAVPTPTADQVKALSDAGDQASLLALAQMGLAKRNELSRREQSISIVGAGASLFGIAVLLYVQIPAGPKEKNEKNDSPAGASPTAGSSESADPASNNSTQSPT